MRDIEFRMWNPSNKVMTAGHTLNMILATTDNDFVNEFDHKKMVWLQYIGLKDNNEKKVYEGDIVNTHRFIECLGQDMGVFEDEEELICEVVYIPENAAFGFMPADKKDFGYLEPLRLSDEGLEIIGNIYENPGLLK